MRFINLDDIGLPSGIQKSSNHPNKMLWQCFDLTQMKYPFFRFVSAPSKDYKLRHVQNSWKIIS